jgi:TRAP-type C4-dicarboxylate transport system substrate-binding protein
MPLAVRAEQPYKTEYKLSIAAGPTYAWGKGAETWAQLVRERSGGRINIRVLPGASAVAGDPSREFAALRDGAIDLAIGSALSWSESVKSLHLFALPFLFNGPRNVDAVLRGAVGAELLQSVNAAGVIALGWGDNGFRELSTAARALRKPEDLEGLRIRVTGSGVIDETLTALGATPVRMKPLDAQRALLDRALDGQETNTAVYVATKAHTLGQKHLALWSFAAEPLIFAVSRTAWDGWSESDRGIVREAAAEAAQREIELARNADTAATAAVATELRGSGVVLTRLTTDERNRLAERTKPVLDKWSAVVGSDLVRRAYDAYAASPAR